MVIRRNMFGGPWSEPDDLGPLDNMPHLKIGGHINPHLSDMEEEGKTNFWDSKSLAKKAPVV
eukprot:UN00313